MRAMLSETPGGPESLKLVEIPSVWGHRAGNPRDNPEDVAFIDAQVEALLEA